MQVDPLLPGFLLQLILPLLQYFPDIVVVLQEVVFGVKQHFVSLRLDVHFAHKHFLHHIGAPVVEVGVLQQFFESHPFGRVELNHFQNQVHALQREVELLADVDLSLANFILELL